MRLQRTANWRSKCFSQVVCQRARSHTMEIWDCYWLQNLISIFDEVFCPKLKLPCSLVLLCAFNPCGYLYFLDSSWVEHTPFTCICTMTIKSYSVSLCTEIVSSDGKHWFSSEGDVANTIILPPPKAQHFRIFTALWPYDLTAVGRSCSTCSGSSACVADASATGPDNE